MPTKRYIPVKERVFRGLFFMKLFFMRKLSVGAFLAILVTAIIVSLFAAGLLTVTQTISSSGTITAVNIGVYSDSACTQILSSITWGLISPGDSVAKTVYVKNTGNAPVTLSISTNAWNPVSANGPITLSWDKAGAVLNAGQSTAAVLTLNVSPSISGVTSFSVNIQIAGTG
jgi:hypothetical protein